MKKYKLSLSNPQYRWQVSKWLIGFCCGIECASSNGSRVNILKIIGDPRMPSTIHLESNDERLIGCIKEELRQYDVLIDLL